MNRVSPDEPVRRREIAAWCSYDFADSAFTTVIVTAFFVLYFKHVVVGDPGLGDWYWGLANAGSALVMAMLAPVLGAIADHSGSKRIFLRACAVLIVVFTAGLFFVQPGMVAVGMALFIIANIGFAGGVIFIDAFLPEISRAGNVGRISGYRWGLGYIGGMACLGLILPLASGGFSADNLLSARAVFPVVALWYLVWSLPTFLVLRERALHRPLPPGHGYLRVGFGRLAVTLRHIRRYRELFKFLLAFWVYNDAIVTVIVFASAYAADTLQFTVTENLLLIFSVNVPAAAGALLFGRLLDRLGAKRTVVLTLLLWLGVVTLTVFTTTKAVFFGVAVLAGIGLGSCQSTSRSLMALLTPRAKSAEFFGFLGLAGKISAILGPLLFGLISVTTGSQRLAVSMIGLFFLAGLLILLSVDERDGIAAAARPMEEG
jgi:UMF1 family MFS transporter